MPGKDPERIADTLRRVATGEMMLTIKPGRARQIPPEILSHAADEMDRMRWALLDTSDWLYQLATERGGMSPRDMRALARKLTAAGNRQEDET